jgi:DNA repair protein RecO (recombination protein O)
LNAWLTQGFVLSARPYLESDKLIDVYTRQFGKIRARVKGARKPKSRMGFALELFTESSLSFMKGPSSELYLLTQAKILQGHPLLKEDFGTITLLQVMADLLIHTIHDSQPDEELYGLIRKILETMEAQPGVRETVMTAFILRFLELLGHPLELELCAECQKPLGAPGAFLIAHRGGALCSDCCPSGSVFLKVSPAGLGLLQKMRGLPLDRLAELKMEKNQSREMLFVLLAYLERTIEKPLKSVEYYRALLPLGGEAWS